MRAKVRTETGENVGPTWGNVQVTARYVSRQHHCFVKVVMEPKMLSSDIYAMEVRAEAWSRGVGVQQRRISHKAKQWPSKGHKTMPSMIYWLLMDLDADLEGMAAAKQEALPF